MRAGVVLAHAYIPPTAAFAAPEISLAYAVMEDRRESREERLLDRVQGLAASWCSKLLLFGSVPTKDEAMLSDAEYTLVLRRAI